MKNMAVMLKSAMEDYKIVDFLNDYPGQPFPSFKKMELVEGLEFCDIFASHLGLPHKTDPLIVLTNLADRAKFIKHLDLENFDLSELLSSLSIEITSDQSIYIDWMRFSDIHQMQLSDLSQYFLDIWYGEDISIFDDTLTWMIFIFHYKAITIFKI